MRTPYTESKKILKISAVSALEGSSNYFARFGQVVDRVAIVEARSIREDTARDEEE